MKRTMEHNAGDGLFAFIVGTTTGIFKFFAFDIIADSFPVRLVEAVVTAFICGIAGVLGKHVVTKVMSYFNKPKPHN